MKPSPRIIVSAITLSSALIFGASSAHALEVGTTGTGLDRIVEIINTDERLNRRVPENEIIEASMAADTLNHMIVDAIRNTGVANDGVISKADTRELNDYIFANYYSD